MLVSEQEERGRKFKLALRAGLPILFLISLVAYSTFWRGGTFAFTLRDATMIVALMFVTTYFIFFLLEEDGQKSLIDPTTNGYNYSAFRRHYTAHHPHALALLTLGNLSIINENYGSRTVDKMLRSLIYQLNATLSAYGIPRAVIGRRHGAEFLIGTQTDESTLRETLLMFVRDHPSVQEIEIDLHVAVIADPDAPLEEVIGHLHDSMVSQCDTQGATEEAHAPAIHTAQELEASILYAIDHQQVRFSFRPLYRVETSTIDTYEIMPKLYLEDGHTVLPRVYLPIVNRLGFGQEYDTAILRHILSILPLVDARIAFSFNLSPFSLRNGEFQDRAFDMVAQSGVDPSRLIVELYERKTHHNLKGYLKTLEEFRARGLRICIDNFGTSNASMEYMRHFKFDMVQFDRDYVGHIEDPKSRAMLQSLITMSKSLHIVTVAKWVDKEEQKEKLIAMGIDYLQGFGIAKPLSESQLINTYN